jgi:hypothetical protein
MDRRKHIGMNVHQVSISAAVRDDAGELVMECVIETKARTSWNSFKECVGAYVTFEEGTSAAWLYDLVKPHIAQAVVCFAEERAAEGATRMIGWMHGS